MFLMSQVSLYLEALDEDALPGLRALRNLVLA